MSEAPHEKTSEDAAAQSTMLTSIEKLRKAKKAKKKKKKKKKKRAREEAESQLKKKQKTQESDDKETLSETSPNDDEVATFDPETGKHDASPEPTETVVEEDVPMDDAPPPSTPEDAQGDMKTTTSPETPPSNAEVIDKSEPAPSEEEAKEESEPAPSEEETKEESEPAPSEEEAKEESEPAPSEEEAKEESEPAPSEEEETVAVSADETEVNEVSDTPKEEKVSKKKTKKSKKPLKDKDGVQPTKKTLKKKKNSTRRLEAELEKKENFFEKEYAKGNYSIFMDYVKVFDRSGCDPELLDPTWQMRCLGFDFTLENFRKCERRPPPNETLIKRITANPDNFKPEVQFIGFANLGNSQKAIGTYCIHCRPIVVNADNLIDCSEEESSS